MTPLKLIPGRLSASLAIATPSSTLLTPALFIWVSTSISTPIWTPYADAISEIVWTFSKLSTHTFISPCFASAHILAILSLCVTWFGINTSVTPPSNITSASDSLAVHTPPTVPPVLICILAKSGLLVFLVC